MTRGFQVFVFRMDGYSWTKALPGGECIISEEFNVGGRFWHIDYYPERHQRLLQ
jgi:speckle-type POZ protein